MWAVCVYTTIMKCGPRVPVIHVQRRKKIYIYKRNKKKKLIKIPDSRRNRLYNVTLYSITNYVITTGRVLKIWITHTIIKYNVGILRAARTSYKIIYNVFFFLMHITRFIPARR